MKKKMILAPALVLAIAGIVMYSTAVSYAQEAAGEYPAIVERLAEKFDLDVEDVQSVLDEAKDERMAEMNARVEGRLDQAVAEGKITEDQKQLIITKHGELQTEREASIDSWQGMTQEARREAMQKKHDELKAWAQENGIDLGMFMPFGGMHKMGRGHGEWVN